MKLYYSPGACSLAPHIIAREMGMSVDLEKVDLAAKKTEKGGNFLAVNPKGYVPVLELDGGEVLTEVPVVLQYLADQKPAAALAPNAGTMERYRLQEWLNFITSELHKAFSPLFRPDTPKEFAEIAKRNLGNRFAYLDRHFAANEYLMGKRFTVADPYCFTVLGWAKFLKMDLKPYPNVLAYLKRVGARPSVQEALKAEGLLKAA